MYSAKNRLCFRHPHYLDDGIIFSNRIASSEEVECPRGNLHLLSILRIRGHSIYWISPFARSCFHSLGKPLSFRGVSFCLLFPFLRLLWLIVLHISWQSYDWAAAIVMTAAFAIFLLDFLSHRAGAKYLRKRGLTLGLDSSRHACGGPTTLNIASDVAPGPVTSIKSINGTKDLERVVSNQDCVVLKTPVGSDESSVYSESATAKVIAVAILEFGIIFHSMIIGLTLAVSSGFEVLFIAIVFHRASFI